MAATANVPQAPESGAAGHLNQLTVLESVHFYEGAMAGVSSGYARPLVAGDQFVGHALAEANNAAGASGDIYVTLRQGRYRMKQTLASVAITDVGKPVFASADNTYTLTPSTYSRVGTVVRYVAANTCIIEFDTMPQPAEAAQSGKDVTLTCGNDFLIRPGLAAADIVALQAYDIDGSAWVSVVRGLSHATDVLLSFFGAAGGSKQAHIASAGLSGATQATTTEIRALSVAVDAALAAMRTYGLLATQ